MKLSRNNQHKYIMLRTYSHHDIDMDDLDGEFWPMMGILFTIWGSWTGVIHFIDWLTFDTIAWYIEPFTIAPVLFLFIMHEKYSSLNPLHWWPIFFGYKIKLPSYDKIKVYPPLDGNDLLKKYGGPLHIHIVDYEHVKFRKKKDAVMYALKNFN